MLVLPILSVKGPRPGRVGLCTLGRREPPSTKLRSPGAVSHHYHLRIVAHVATDTSVDTEPPVSLRFVWRSQTFPVCFFCILPSSGMLHTRHFVNSVEWMNEWMSRYRWFRTARKKNHPQIDKVFYQKIAEHIIHIFILSVWTQSNKNDASSAYRLNYLSMYRLSTYLSI